MAEGGVEILCVGTELLLGDILNGNARWIAERLAGLGGCEEERQLGRRLVAKTLRQRDAPPRRARRRPHPLLVVDSLALQGLTRSVPSLVNSIEYYTFYMP